jgi:hypothetical protein
MYTQLQEGAIAGLQEGTAKGRRPTVVSAGRS